LDVLSTKVQKFITNVKLIFFWFGANASPAAAVRGLLVVSFLILYRLYVCRMPASGNRPHCSADGSLVAVDFNFLYFSIRKQT
jgi:hypothetical protein